MNETEPDKEDSGDDRPAADGDHTTGTDRRRSPVVADEANAGSLAGQPEAVDVAAVAELTPVLEDLAVDTADEDGTAEQVTEAAPAPAAGSDETGPVVAVEPAAATTTSAGETVDRLPAEADGEVEADTVPWQSRSTEQGGADEIDLNGTDSAIGGENAERIDGVPSNVGPVVEQVESNDEVDETGAAEAGVGDVRSGTAGVAHSNVAVAGGDAMADRSRSSVPDAEPTTLSTDSYSSPDVPDSGVAPLGRQATAGQVETEPDPATGIPSPAPDATELGETDPQPGAGGDPSVEQPAGFGNDRPPSGLSPDTSFRAPASTQIRSTTAAVETSNPAPELVELQTTGLAERLRPAFAAVRRGVNGLDELRLRIQDDNAGPIKVDIATIDNRVRVLLSTGNDDLMRQLGQERDRLADELRRAGFDQASVDIAAGDSGPRRGRYDEEPSDRSGSGAVGTGRSGVAGTGALDGASSRRHRGLTGLDLDL